jgi:hypothetical protein
MRGRLTEAWQASRERVWRPLAKHPAASEDLFCELYRALVHAIGASEMDDAAAFSDPRLARLRFVRVSPSRFANERQVRHFFEDAYCTLSDIDQGLADHYGMLLEKFFARMNLRYRVRMPFQIVVTVSGVFAELSNQLRTACGSNVHLLERLDEFEASFGDLSKDSHSARIKTCVHKQMNLLEALACHTLGQAGGSFGAACNGLQSWPHATLRESAKKVYGFTSDYPGIRHAGNVNGVLREIDMRDLIAVATLLLGYTPYMTDAFDPDEVFHGLAA